jgi:hypothetical protein
VDEGREVLARIEPPVEAAHLGGEAVEAIEERVELPVAQILPVHTTMIGSPIGAR